MSEGNAYRVVVLHNLVIRVDRISADAGAAVSTTNLEAGMQLAANQKNNGCIDGEYIFSNRDKAKDFAALSLDFVLRLAEKSLDSLNGHNFFALPDWGNDFLADNQQ